MSSRVLTPETACKNVVQSAVKWQKTEQSQPALKGSAPEQAPDWSQKSAIIIGSGVGGLALAHELEQQLGLKDITMLEARDRTGGRCLTLHHGDVISESKTECYQDNKIAISQTVNFPNGHGEREGLPKVYLNAGPGRVSSSHKYVHYYLKKFNVPVEVYVMQSSSNLVGGNPDAGLSSIPYRQLQHNIRGNIAKYIANHASEVLRYFEDKDDETPTPEFQGQLIALQNLMQAFGGLVRLPNSVPNQFDYIVRAPEAGRDDTSSDRAGYVRTPEGEPGKTVDPMKLVEALKWAQNLNFNFWEKIYQQMDYLWQATLVQPVGGMDQIPKSIEKHLNNTKIHLESPVTHITYLEDEGKFKVTVQCPKTEEETVYKADYLFCNLSMVFLDHLLDDSLKQSLDPGFREGLEAIWNLERENGDRFLAYTTKVGWQAKRSLWQYERVQLNPDGSEKALEPEQEAEIPMFGGISWSPREITQIWYPSMDFNDDYGVLTGCYNFGENAVTMGDRPVEDRLRQAREDAKALKTSFGDGLNIENGVSVAWHKVPYIKGGWAQWDAVPPTEGSSVKYFNDIRHGSAIQGDDSALPRFFIVGDQVSSLPGWQEGAIASAWEIVKRLRGEPIPLANKVPSSLALVEGIGAIGGELAYSVLGPVQDLNGRQNQ